MVDGKKFDLPLAFLPKAMQKLLTDQDDYINFMQNKGKPLSFVRLFADDWNKLNEALGRIQVAQHGILITPQDGYSLHNCTYRGLPVVKQSRE